MPAGVAVSEPEVEQYAETMELANYESACEPSHVVYNNFADDT